MTQTTKTQALSELHAVGLTDDDVARVRATLAGESPASLDAFHELARLGRYPARTLVRHPEWLVDISEGAQRARDARTLERAIRREIGEDDDQLYPVMRHTKQRESLRILLRETRGVSTRETTAELADLAEACLSTAVSTLASGRFAGLDELFCVLGMGKLGGRELNPSSDVDLIFVCDDQALHDAELQVLVADFARAVVDAIAAQTEEGYVFRVDLRLRPDGSQGPIVLPVRTTQDYYLQFGRTWERSALMKARPVAGAHTLGAGLLEAIEPFVYRRSLDFGALEELRAMKAKIEANASLGAVHGSSEPGPAQGPDTAQAPLADRLKRRLSGRSSRPRVSKPQPAAPAAPDHDERGLLGWDLKIGVGGIREIEFFVQALQLVHSGRQPGLRVRNTLEALDALLWAGLITDIDHAALTDAYDLWRRLEHLLQMGDDRQTHTLPTTTAEFDVLARRFDTAPGELDDRITYVRETVRAIFERLFAPSERTAVQPTLRDDRGGQLDVVARAGTRQLRTAGMQTVLGQLGFRRPRQVAGQLEVLRNKTWGPFRESAWGTEVELARQIVGNAAAAPDPDQAFSHFSRFAQAVGDRPGYWSMLAGNPHATRLLLQVFGSSPYFAGALIADPNVFERLLAVGSVAVEKGAARMRGELQARLADVTDQEHRLGVIRRFHREETLRVGLHETGGAAQVEQTLEQLSILAEVVIDAVLFEVYQPLRTRKRRPGSVLPELDEIAFAVVAMGKLGGRELGFGSDLDVVFVYEEDRQFKLEHTFYARLGQRLIRTLSTTGVEGKMYEVDTRLRPSGSRGALVVSVDAFAEYYEKEAGLWERQALIRGRPISGPDRLLARIAEIRQETAFGARAGADELAEVARMRERMNDALYKRGTRDVKFGPGGLVDIEFATQAMQLASAVEPHGDPRLVLDGTASQSTRIALAALGQRDVAEDYLWLCRLLARTRMSGGLASTSVLPDDDETLLMIARRLGHQGDGALASFTDEFDARTGRTRQFFEDILG